MVTPTDVTRGCAEDIIGLLKAYAWPNGSKPASIIDWSATDSDAVSGPSVLVLTYIESAHEKDAGKNGVYYTPAAQIECYSKSRIALRAIVDDVIDCIFKAVDDTGKPNRYASAFTTISKIAPSGLRCFPPLKTKDNGHWRQTIFLRIYSKQ